MQVKFTPEASDELSALALGTGQSVAGTIQMALKILQIVLAAKKEGKEVLIVDSRGGTPDRLVLDCVDAKPTPPLRLV